MGCGASNAVNVQPVAQADSSKEPLKKPASAGKRSLNNKVGVLVEENNNKNLKKSGRTSSRSSLRGSRTSLSARSETSSERGGSAVSKKSKHSCDSGLGDDYAHVITENSDRSRIEEVEKLFQANDDLDLSITGTPVTRLLSGKDRARQEEENVLATLREEGLISRPKSRAGGGISFEVVVDTPDEKAFARPPARLAKLEKRKKKKKALTEDEIRAKLEKAEERRKKKEQEKLERIESVTNKSDINQALNTFAKQQQSKETTVTEKMSTIEENREKKLQELRNKLKAKEEHAERVRRRKKLLPIVPHPESAAATEAAELKA